MNRRVFLSLTAASATAPGWAFARTREIWSAPETAEALSAGAVILIDIRSRREWRQTGIAEGAWPISMHEDRFAERLLAAREMARGAQVALICATGGRSARLLRALKSAGYTEFIDVSEGMLGSRRGAGWIARGLPVVEMNAALAALPGPLR